MAHVTLQPTTAQPVDAAPTLQVHLREAIPQGLAIYRNAYTARLIGVLESDHEKLLGFIGADRFNEIARSYIEQCPSQSRSLRQFGDRLPEFIAGLEHEHAAEMALLCRFERTLLDVYDAPDADSFGFERIAAIAPEQWPGLGLGFHPSLRVLTLGAQTVRHWQQLHAGVAISVADLPNAKLRRPVAPDVHWLLWRNRDRVSQFRQVDAAEVAAIEAFQVPEATLATVAEVVLDLVGVDAIVAQLNEWLRTWSGEGLISRVSLLDGIKPLER